MASPKTNDVWHRQRGKHEFRDSMFSSKLEKVGPINLITPNVGNCHVELSGHYLRYYEIWENKRNSIFIFRKKRQSKKIKYKPDACVDIRLIEAQLRHDADTSFVFRLSSSVDSDFLDFQATSFKEAQSWVRAINGASNTVRAEQIRRSIARGNGTRTQVFAKPEMEAVASTFPHYDKVLSFNRQEATASRELFCKEGKGFFLLSFNILANRYVEMCRTPELYDHCPKECLPWAYRLPIILSHLTSCNADIICLQEVERDSFEKELRPVLSLLGYAGEIECNAVKRDGVSNELPGNAIFFKTSQFSLVWKELPFRTLLLGLEILQGPRKGNIVAVANSHLEGAPWRHADRANQIGSAFKKLGKRQATKRCYVVFAGDYNDGALSDVCQNIVSTKHSMYSAYDSHPARDVTCLLTPGDSETMDIEQSRVDHIFFDQSLDLKASMNVMDPEWSRDMTLEKGLPSLAWPSDHLSVGAMFVYNEPPGPVKAESGTKSPFDGLSCQEMLACSACPLTNEQRDKWLQLTNSCPVPPKGRKPTPEEVTAMKTARAAKEEFVNSFEVETKLFLKAYTAAHRKEAKAKSRKPRLSIALSSPLKTVQLLNPRLSSSKSAPPVVDTSLAGNPAANPPVGPGVGMKEVDPPGKVEDSS